MSLLTDILVWSNANLLPWQRDALRRLFQYQECSSQDSDDLYAMLKSARGLPDPQNRQPSPLAAEHLPVRSSGADVVVLNALRELKNVNRIADGEKLTFGPKGITIIYGGNGSGKSGYSRVLKRACKMRRQYSRLRATIDRIIQDVVFNGVLHRYRDRISIDRLDGVVGFTGSEFREIERLHKACCGVIDSHDASSVKNESVPTAKQLGQDIEDVRGDCKSG